MKIKEPKKTPIYSNRRVSSWFKERSISTDPDLLASGVVHCQITSSIFPYLIDMKNVQNSKVEHRRIYNWKIFLNAMMKMGVKKEFSISKLMVPNTIEMKELNCWIISFVDMNKETSANCLDLTPKVTKKSPVETPLRTPSCMRTPVKIVSKKEVVLCTPNAAKAKTPRRNRPAGILEQMEEYLGITLWTPQKAQQTKIVTRTPNGSCSEERWEESEARMELLRRQEKHWTELADMDTQQKDRKGRAYLEDQAKTSTETDSIKP